eukprot:500185-Amphidinium_carterae.1
MKGCGQAAWKGCLSIPGKLLRRLQTLDKRTTNSNGNSKNTAMLSFHTKGQNHTQLFANDFPIVGGTVVGILLVRPFK